MYAAEVNGQRLTFQVAGVHLRNMIIRDRETGTLWQQATGAALLGPLKGSQLQPLGGELASLSKWQAMNPHTSIAVEPVPKHGRYPGLIPRDRLNHLLETFTTNYAASGMVNDKRLRMHAEVVGVSLDGVDKAYPMTVIRRHGVIHDQVGENHICIAYDPDADYVVAFQCPATDEGIELDTEDGILSARDGMIRWTWMGDPRTANTPPLQKLRIERQWWLGWVEFHPASDIYQASP